MHIVTLKPDETFAVKPLWEKLNRLHKERSDFFKEHFDTFTFEKRIAQFNDRDAVRVFAAKKNDAIIGYCIASTKDRIGEIDSIYVKTGFRKEGVGDRLMDYAENWLKEQNILKLNISVAQGNEEAFAFYNRHGYKHRFSVLEKAAD